MKEITEQDRQDWQAIAPMLSESERESLGVKTVQEAQQEKRRQSSVYKQTARDLETDHGPGLQATLIK